ncbi:MAG: hypothetical protein WA821_13495 [Anaerolineales bacterium]
MPSFIRLFLTGFILTLLLFLAVNLLAAHLQSDCGLPAFFNLSGCADDIRRAGFPFLFYEEGGFAGETALNCGDLLKAQKERFGHGLHGVTRILLVF